VETSPVYLGCLERVRPSAHRAFWGERKARAVTEQTIFANKQNTSRTGTSFVPKNVTKGKSIASAFGACTPDVSDARAKLSSRADIFGGAFGTSVVTAVEPSSSSMTTTTTLGEEETKTCLLKNIYASLFQKVLLSLSYFRVLKFRVPQKEEEEEEEEEDLNDKTHATVREEEEEEEEEEEWRARK
jgi:hypothetical protein